MIKGMDVWSDDEELRRFGIVIVVMIVFACIGLELMGTEAVLQVCDLICLLPG